jgi:hypothetical protein
VVPRRIAATAACAAAHLPLAIRLLDDSYDEPTQLPCPSHEANEVQLLASITTLLDEADAVRIGIFPAWPAR